MTIPYLDALFSDGAFPGCACAVVDSSGIIEKAILGYREIVPEKKEMTEDTLFDMASISKILGPAMVALALHHENYLDFDLRIKDVISKAGNFGEVTVFQLLTHSAGFLPELPLWRYSENADDFFSRILNSEMQFLPGTSVIYSCLGYIILGHLLEIITGKPLGELASSLVWNRIGMRSTTYHPDLSSPIAATERIHPDGEACWCGVVHDENARFLLPGQSGNAGVFSTLSDISRFVIFLLREMKSPSFFTAEEVRLFSTDQTPFAPFSRSVGFMVNARGYSCNGGVVSGKNSFGHTGFTGTSIWISPDLDAGVILLSNRVHPTRENKLLREKLGTFHDSVFGSIRSKYD